ncbi:MAG: PaaI family thioesterase [Syntrophales bacterium]
MKQKDSFLERFLTGGPPRREGSSLAAVLRTDRHAEGWNGIPHGGFAMGVFVELALRAMGESASSFPEPWTAEFRLGGASLRRGDRADVKVDVAARGAEGVITVPTTEAPYMTASLCRQETDMESLASLRSLLPASTPDPDRECIPLPSYGKCFVCGSEREIPGLERRFSLLPSGSGKTIFSRAGFEDGDERSFHLFQEDGIIHPVTILALLDETLGWGGFMLAGQGGVTVRIRFAFLRRIRAGEKLIFLGRGDRVRGTSPSRMFSWASGGAAAVHPDGGLEPVVTATGQFMVVPELTEQMKTTLLPREWTERAFRLAGLEI